MPMNKLSVLLVAATTASALRVASGPATPKAGIGRRQAAACLAGAALASSNVAPSLADEADFPAPPPAPGIKVEILEKGDASSPTPQRAQNVVVDYTLWVDGFEKKLVDSSKGSAFPPKLPSPFKFTVGVGQVIPGWDRTVMEMHVGEKRRVVIPSSLGYGDKGVGPIPGKADLYFEIEMLELRPMKTLSPDQEKWLAEHPMR